MVATSSQWQNALSPGVFAWYEDAMSRHQKEYDKIFTIEKSKRAFEEIIGQVGTGLLVVKSEGGDTTYQNTEQGFRSRFQHVEYALGTILTRNAYEDNLYDMALKDQGYALANSAMETTETVAANVLNRAFNSSYLGGDGLELCSTLHVNVSGGTYANELTTAADLSEASLEQAIIDIGKFTNDRGHKVAVRPQKLVIPVDLEFEATRILDSVGRSGTADNDLNALNSLSKIPGGIIVNHYLTDTDAWFITTDAPKGLIMFERRAPEMTMDNDFDTENMKHKVTTRFSVGWANPRGIFGSPGA